MTSLVAGWLLGLVLGMRHACEPDHLAAVSTLIDARPGRGKATMAVGAFWGTGHALALLSVAGVLALLRARLPVSLSLGFELLVALMLIGLGARALLRERRRWREHADGGGRGPSVDVRPAPIEEAAAPAGWTLARRPLLVGLVHGLAGSGALAALVMANLPSLGARLGYIALFSLGSIVGMSALTTFAAWQLGRVARSLRLARGLAIATGSLSLGLGGWWGWAATASLLGL
ncbi:MAG TPA: urease accessory protein [Polyangia bacterium]